jgi:CHAD domain-containing protein
MAEFAKEKPGTRYIAKHLQKQVGTALETLERARLTDSDVHDARKSLKKARASLRLLRFSIGQGHYRAQNVALRDAARPLSAARDSKVLLDTLDMLRDRYGEPAEALQVDGLTRVLKARRARLTREVLTGRTGSRAHSRRLLRESGKFADTLAAKRGANDWSALCTGLQRVYAQGRRAMAAAKDEPTPEAFHDWRKRVKYLRYSLEMLEPLWPGMIGVLADQAHKLSDYLGDEHDFNVLREAAVANRSAFRDPGSLSALLALIDRAREELREKALLLGSRLYEEKPRAFARRFAQYWRDWRAEPVAA